MAHGSCLRSTFSLPPPPPNVGAAVAIKLRWHESTDSLWHRGSVAARGRLGASVRPAARAALNPLFNTTSIHGAASRREDALLQLVNLGAA